MSLAVINLGSSPAGDGGESAREAFTKVNANFASLVTTFDVTAAGTAIAIPFTFTTAGGYLVTFQVVEGVNVRSVTGVAVIGGSDGAQRTWVPLGDNGVGTNRYTSTALTATGLTVTVTTTASHRVRGSVLAWHPPV